jgi:4-amino-4-deoxy-L-arabinose transferase-like glycosyltransferase
VALALVLRVGAVVATPDYRPVHDDRDYDRYACWVSRHGMLPAVSPPFPSRRDCAPAPGQRAGHPTAYRPPLWPLTLGAAYAAAEPLPVGRWTAGRLLQAALGTVVVALTGALAAALCGSGAGLAALALAAVFLPLVLDGATLISEPLFVALELGAVLASLRQRGAPGRLRWAVAAGVLVGLAGLTRANGLVLALPLLALVWSVDPRTGRRSPLAPVALAVAALAVTAPWTIRNAHVLHAFVPVSTQSGTTLLGTYNEVARRSRPCRGCWVLLERRARLKPIAAELHRLGEVERDRRARALALGFARRHPWYVAQVAWGNSVRLVELGGARRIRNAARSIDVSPRAATAGAWEFYAILAIAAIGALGGALRRAPPALIALPVLLWITTVLVQSETPRFRAPLDPFILVLAGAGVTAAARLRR